jgi:hypothetical protein
MARNLVLMAIPAHIVYLFVTVIVKENTSMTVAFLLLYICAAIVQVSTNSKLEESAFYFLSSNFFQPNPVPFTLCLRRPSSNFPLVNF